MPSEPATPEQLTDLCNALIRSIMNHSKTLEEIVRRLEVLEAKVNAGS
jgi:hypothetical protein